MKKDWTYKKLGEVCDINYGTRVVQKKDGGSIYPVYGGGGATFRMDTYNREDCLVVARFAMSPKCTRIVKGKFFLNDSGLTLDAHEELYQDYLNWHIISLNDEIYQTAKGAAQKNLDVKAFTSLKIAIPPLSIQRSIIAELDLLHSVISKKKEQLRELDNLAQSLFYQMFGDPITNPMGWEVKKLGEVGTFERGKGISKSDFVDDGVPCVHYGQLHTAFGAYTTKHLACIPESLIDNPRIAHPGDVLLALTSEDVEGSCKSTAWYGDYDIIVGSDAAVYHHNQDGMYISFYTRTEAFYKQKEKYAHGFKVTHISTKDIETFTIPLPPLSLQQSFATKVSAIEAQKQAITLSIKETEALLAQRMDTYFC